MSLQWKEKSVGESDQKLDTLGHCIPKCIEGTVRGGKSIVGVGFERLLVDTGECDARHGFKVFV